MQLKSVAIRPAMLLLADFLVQVEGLWR
jgi:hypothetical protein